MLKSFPLTLSVTMPLLDLPDELLRLIIESLDNEKDILSFLLTDPRVYGIQ